ncbi:MAG: DEAD/DEAH box helicase [Flavobacteriales bacterium]|nr:DEAD/DEAH box helicase [Flavobacteriales bacterium]
MSSFQSLGIRAEILRALTDLGFEKPTPVQAATIPLLLADEGDMVALARTGTGKTAAFSIPCWSASTPPKKPCKAWCSAPTRTLRCRSPGLRRYAAHLPARSRPLAWRCKHPRTDARHQRGANVGGSHARSIGRPA